jgi:hypothetical protein
MMRVIEIRLSNGAILVGANGLRFFGAMCGAGMGWHWSESFRLGAFVAADVPPIPNGAKEPEVDSCIVSRVVGIREVVGELAGAAQ